MNKLETSQLDLRKSIGVMGMLLAFVVVIGGFLSGGLLNSISNYYYSNMQDVFVGVLMITGAFLLTYRGYDIVDRVFAIIAGIAAIAVVVFPMGIGIDGVGTLMLSGGLSNALHFISAGTMFLSLAYISYFQFTKSGGELTTSKIKRNRVYRTSGIIIFSSFVVVALTAIISTGPLVLILEAVMLIAFGASWLVKGEAILKDVE